MCMQTTHENWTLQLSREIKRRHKFCTWCRGKKQRLQPKVKSKNSYYTVCLGICLTPCYLKNLTTKQKSTNKSECRFFDRKIFIPPPTLLKKTCRYCRGLRIHTEYQTVFSSPSLQVQYRALKNCFQAGKRTEYSPLMPHHAQTGDRRPHH